MLLTTIGFILLCVAVALLCVAVASHRNKLKSYGIIIDSLSATVAKMQTDRPRAANAPPVASFSFKGAAK